MLDTLPLVFSLLDNLPNLFSLSSYIVFLSPYQACHFAVHFCLFFCICQTSCTQDSQRPHQYQVRLEKKKKSVWIHKHTCLCTFILNWFWLLVHDRLFAHLPPPPFFLRKRSICLYFYSTVILKLFVLIFYNILTYFCSTDFLIYLKTIWINFLVSVIPPLISNCIVFHTKFLKQKTITTTKN